MSPLTKGGGRVELRGGVVRGVGWLGGVVYRVCVFGLHHDA